MASNSKIFQRKKTENWSNQRKKFGVNAALGDGWSDVEDKLDVLEDCDRH